MDGRIRFIVSGLIVVGVDIAPYVSVSQLMAQTVERVDHGAIALIQEEALERSQIMDIAWHLTDLYGSRQTGSPAAENAWLQAEALGLGALFIGAFDDGAVKEALALPEDHEPLGMPTGRKADDWREKRFSLE